MDLTRLQVENFLNVSPTDLDIFIEQQNLPYYTLGEEKRFNLLEIESWMIQHKFWEGLNQNFPYNFYRALARGGFCHLNDLGDGSILKLGAYHLSQKLHIDPEGLYAILQDREILASTGMGDGIAIPHPRERLESVKQDIIFIVHLDQPIAFNAIDEKKVHTFLFLIAGSDKSHLNLLSKMALAVRHQVIKNWIHPQTTITSLLKDVLEWETSLSHSHK
jgi:PTS system nitrogen regulatory IIA component